MLPIWQTADDIDVFESGWTFDHFYPIFSDSSGPFADVSNLNAGGGSELH